MGALHSCMPAFGLARASGDEHQKPKHGVLMDLRRRAQLTEARPNEHDGEVLEMEKADFDISKTIFKHMDARFLPWIKQSFAKELFWSDGAVARIERRTAEMLIEDPQWANLRAHDPELIKFMKEECEFDVEHADGSFLDHLQFCFEYGSVHMPEHSAVPLFLHSIMGVGTNLFPMKLERRPRLAELVSADDLIHIEAFPSVLRLLLSYRLLHELVSMPVDELNAIEEFECYRLLGPDMDHDGLRGCSDNAPLKLTAQQFWVHLNYQLIHSMDFLPASRWKELTDQPAFYLFIHLHRLLARAGRLYARVCFDSEKWAEEATTAGAAGVEAFADKIGFRLEHKLRVSGSVRCSPKLGGA